MKIAIHNHQSKGEPLARALLAQGHTLSGDQPDIFLIDHDGPQYYRDQIDRAQKGKIPVWLYSHGAMSCMAWDGWWEPHPYVSGYLAIGPGHKEVMTRYGYPNPVHVIGWYWCPQGSFEPTRPRDVLFAPIHPLGNGFLRPEAEEANKRAYDLLLQMPINLTVRHLHRLDSNGLWGAPGVRYIEGRPDNSTADIDAADVVVSWGTFAHLAIARGKPTVMYCQDGPPGNGHSIDEMKYAASWDAYGDFMRYPLDLFEGDAWGVVQLAASGNADISAWKRRFIGDPLHPVRFAQLITDLATPKKRKRKRA